MLAAETTLTTQEVEASTRASFDLGPGYPQLRINGKVKDIYSNARHAAVALKVPPEWTLGDQYEIDGLLRESVSDLLGLQGHLADSVRWTFSGSIALDRAISAVQRLSRSRGNPHLSVITTTPCIDIMKMFLMERSDVTAEYVQSQRDGFFGRLDVQPLLEAIGRAGERSKEFGVLVLLCSPENPTGATWSADDLKLICETCRLVRATLIVDHCFLLAGVHERDGVVPIWNVETSFADWIAVWDTGKTFGLNEDKLGFLVSGGEYVGNAVHQALGILQFDVARRSKSLFAALLGTPASFDAIIHLREVCRKNYAELVIQANETAPVLPLSAGSLALVDISKSHLTDFEIRNQLLTKGVGVISGNVFFHSDWRPKKLLRLALARDPEYFQLGLALLLKSLD